MNPHPDSYFRLQFRAVTRKMKWDKTSVLVLAWNWGRADDQLCFYCRSLKGGAAHLLPTPTKYKPRHNCFCSSVRSGYCLAASPQTLTLFFKAVCDMLHRKGKQRERRGSEENVADASLLTPCGMLHRTFITCFWGRNKQKSLLVKKVTQILRMECG